VSDAVAAAAAAVATWVTGSAAVTGTYMFVYSAVYAGITLGVTAAAQALLAPEIPNVEGGKVPRRSPIAPRVVGFGRARIAGATMLYESRPNFAYQVQALHYGKIEGIVQWYLNDDKVSLQESNGYPPPQGWYVIPLADNSYGGGPLQGINQIQYRLGLRTETPYLNIIDELPGVWTSDHRGDRIASAYLRSRSASQEHQQEYYPNGLPMLSVVADLSRVWDWRLSGQDPDDADTWEWSNNPIVCLAAYLTNHIGETDLGVGMGFDFDEKIRPNLDYWTDAANYCDELVALKAGGFVARYTIGLFFYTVTDPAEVIRTILESCDGWMSPDGRGAFMIFPGRYTGPTATLNRNNIVGYQVQRYAEDEQAANKLILSFTDPNFDYTLVETDPWIDQDDIDARGEFTTPVAFNAVQNNSQARRLAKRLMSRLLAARGTISTNLSGLKILGSRYVRIILPQMNYLADRIVEITAVEYDLPNMRLTFQWVAADPNVDDWNPATEEGDGPATETRPALEPVTQPNILYVSVFASTATPDSDGVRIRISAGGPDRADLTWFARWRVQGDVSWSESQYTDLDPDEDVILETSFVPMNETIEVEVSYTTGAGTLAPWSDPATVVTSEDAIVPSAPFDLAAIEASLSPPTAAVSWRNPTSSVFRYSIVFRATSSDFNTASDVSGQLPGSLGEAVTFDDELPAPGDYWYWVEAYNTGGDGSGPTGPVAVTVS
jgi:hypothetical protein